MKRIIALLAIIGAGAAVYVYAQSNDISLAEEIDSVSEEKVKDFQETTTKQLGEFSQKAKEMGEETKKVLGDSVRVDDSEPSFQEKAVEYGQYLYCKQVVDGFESKQ